MLLKTTCFLSIWMMSWIASAFVAVPLRHVPIVESKVSRFESLSSSRESISCCDTSQNSPTMIAEEWIQNFSSGLSEGRIESVVDCFVDDPKSATNDAQNTGSFPAFWRDMVAYTWNIVTLEGKDSIRDMLEATIEERNDQTTTTSWKLATPRPSGRDTFPPPLTTIDDRLCEFWCDIETTAGTGYAHVRLDLQTRKATTVLTTLLELRERAFRVEDKRIRGSTPGPVRGREYFRNLRSRKFDDSESTDYHVAIVGAGQAGLTLAARLEAMEVPYILLEAGSSPGSSWRDARYPSLHLHDPVWYQHMPYLEFPKTWPVFAPKDKLADWLDAYATLMDLNLRTNTRVIQATKDVDDESGKSFWRIKTNAKGPEGEKESVISAGHIVFATGNSSRPRIPKFPGMDDFRGNQLHTSQYKGGEAFAGKRVVVVGSNNSGFDICQDLWEQGAASVTMIQRTGSMIVSIQSVLDHGLFLFSEDPKYHHEDADLILTTTPYKMLAYGGAWKAVTERMKQNDADLIAAVEAAGYEFDYGYDGTGLFAKSATEGGGFYIDVGCAQLLADKDVGVRYATVERLESDAVIIRNKRTSEEERLCADVVVYATGFDTMESYVEQICGPDVVERVGKTWGLGLNYKPDKDPGPWTGELRNMWKPTNVDGLWFHGGNLAQCRHYSKFLALQLAARYSNEPWMPRVYGIPPSVSAKNSPFRN